MDHHLDPQDHLTRYEKQIKPIYLDSVTPSDRPRAIILGGQSGAGKSTIAETATGELGGVKNVVRIDTDALRTFHPKYDEFSMAGKSASSETQYDAQRWRDRLERDAIDSRRNLVIDTTLGWSESAVKTVTRLKDAGYDVEVRVISAHKAESQLSTESRYYGQVDRIGGGRYVDRKYHDEVYPRIPQSLEDLEHKRLVRAIHIVNREGQVVHSQSLDATGNWDQTKMASVALREDREQRAKNPDIAKQHFANWDKLEKLVIKLDIPKTDREALDALRKEHEKEMPQATDRGYRAQAFLLMNSNQIREKFPNDESMTNALLTLKEAQKFANANIDNAGLQNRVIAETKLRLADQLDSNTAIKKPIEKSYENLERRSEHMRPNKIAADDLGRG